MLYNRQLQEQKQAREAEKQLELKRQREQKQVPDDFLFVFLSCMSLILSGNSNVCLLEFQ